MIDIHCHVLHGIDDGSHSLNESVAMCSTAFDNRVTTIIATPHLLRYHEASALSERRDARAAELTAVLAKEKILVKILCGFEVYCNEGILNVSDFSGITLNGSRYMLTEFDFDRENIYGVLKTVNHLLSKGVVPVIAHPERYAFFINDYDALNALADKEVLFQLNVGSLVGLYGYEERRLALTMLQCGYCDILATDAHSLHGRSTNMLEIICQTGELLDSHELKRMTASNPMCIINNEDIQRGARGHIDYDLY